MTWCRMIGEEVSDEDCFDCCEYYPDESMSEEENQEATWDAVRSCMFRQEAHLN